MALGGGNWTSQNKELPGAYTNFSSVAMASAALSGRGVVAIPMAMDWGPEGEIITVTGGDLQKNSKVLLGHAYGDDAMLPLREVFRNASTLHTYRLGTGAVKAACLCAEAKYGGTRGNDLTVKIAANVDDKTAFDVTTYLDGIAVDVQTVKTTQELAPNDFLSFKPSAELKETAGVPLTGGANGTESSGEAHQAFLDQVEGYSFNTLGCPSAEATTVALYVAFTRRMNEDVGANFQLVAYRPVADHETVIGVANKATGYPAALAGMGDYAAVYWTAGAVAGCAVNKSLLNRKYDGELVIDVNHRQNDLKAGIKGGKFMFHSVDGAVRVLDDINTLVTLSDTKGAVFQSNQTIRVRDQISNDVAVLFRTRYLGTVPNDTAGRIGLWSDVCKLLQALVTLRALEDFDTASVTVGPGETKKAVVCEFAALSIINVMGQLYMSALIA